VRSLPQCACARVGVQCARRKKKRCYGASAPTLHGCCCPTWLLLRGWMESEVVARESVGGETVSEEPLRNVRGTHSQRTPNQQALPRLQAINSVRRRTKQRKATLAASSVKRAHMPLPSPRRHSTEPSPLHPRIPNLLPCIAPLAELTCSAEHPRPFSTASLPSLRSFASPRIAAHFGHHRVSKNCLNLRFIRLSRENAELRQCFIYPPACG
jgi:hypothetical protein